MTIEDLLQQWEDEAAMLNEYGAEAQAKALQKAISDLWEWNKRFGSR